MIGGKTMKSVEVLLDEDENESRMRKKVKAVKRCLCELAGKSS